MGNRVVNYVPVKQGIYKVSTAKSGDIGSVLEFEDGRKYVYSVNGTDILTPGQFIQGPIESQYDESVVLASNIAEGDTTVTIEVHASRTGGYTVNELQDGWVQVEDDDSTLIGHARKIKSHPAAAVSTNLVLTLYDAWTDTATAASETLNVMPNPYKAVLLKNGTSDGPIIGVAGLDVIASTSTVKQYFWLQVAGPASVISGESTMVVGDGLTLDGTADPDLCAGANDEFVGWAMQSQDTEGNAVMIMLCLGR